MVYKCILAVSTQSKTDYFACKWSNADRVKGFDGQIHESLDLTLHLKQTIACDNSDESAVCFDEDQSDNLWDLTPETTSFINRAIDKCNYLVVLKFILFTVDGYITRSDFLEQRLDGVKHVSWVDLTTLLSISVGAILLENGPDTLHSVEEELCNRISYPWVVSTPINQKRLAWVEGRKDADVSRRMYEAPAALGITLVIIDKPGYWLQDDHSFFAHLREGFIPTNIDVDGGFVDRIVTAVRSYDRPIDGLMTVSDARLVGVARACEVLGFPTSSSSAYALSGDKYQTRMMETDAHGAFRVFGTDELQQVLQSTEVAYPLIVKSCLGWGSQAVTKVSTETELFRAVEKACECHALTPQQRSDAVVEPYIDGPEVDANFVLLNGKVIFCEISDDFPSPGDVDDQQGHNFLETISILRQGFLTGTFHCEARLQYSSHEFRLGEDGLEDLYLATRHGKTMHVYLLEINARPAGYLETVGVNLVYGVDYFAQQMLFSLNDEVRFRALCHPFHQGPRYNLSLLILQEDVAGIMKTEDAGAELLLRYPELRPHIPLYTTIKKKGDRLVGSKSSEVHFVAWLLVTTQERRECLRLLDWIRGNFEYEVE